MTTSTSRTEPMVRNKAPSKGAVALELGQLHRVVSVSPHTLEPPKTTGKNAMPTSDAVFLTPRVIDETRIEQIISAMRDLIESARDESANLREAVKQVETHTTDSTKLAGRLHERLSLGARMLKAFQSQIDRIGDAVGETRVREERLTTLQETIEQRFKSLEARLESYSGEVDVRLREITDCAVEQYGKKVGEHDPVLRDLELRAGRVEERVESALKRAESVEHAASHLEQEHDRLARQVCETLNETRSIFERLNQGRLVLRDDLDTAEKDIEALCSEAASLANRQQELIAQGRAQTDRMSALRQDADAAIDQLEQRANERVRAAVNEIKCAFGEEIRRCADTWRAIANRTESPADEGPREEQSEVGPDQHPEIVIVPDGVPALRGF